MQYLTSQLIIPIPEDKIIVDLIEYKELKDNELEGCYWSMSDLEKRINKKRDWITQNLLYNPKYKSLLDVKNKGFVFYPVKKGQQWCFQATKMAKFLEDHFADIHNN
ncbi:DUF771 domain-containing protein [Solibacillus sp. FSL R5-0691]|uniref:DUF771 domain-containing protein n=1 Tax=Solibacillus silvestris (strain StLB046) TaxID=1002809 RepID=F2FA30_SOLSS|nr:DUF771 domain-containing protein [Solibacillus silvestris]BAK15696.1 uncharacterized protein SSIL_1273 [Solibacillus silvestris StLB046]